MGPERRLTSNPGSVQLVDSFRLNDEHGRQVQGRPYVGRRWAMTNPGKSLFPRAFGMETQARPFACKEDRLIVVTALSHVL